MQRENVFKTGFETLFDSRAPTLSCPVLRTPKNYWQETTEKLNDLTLRQITLSFIKYSSFMANVTDTYLGRVSFPGCQSQSSNHLISLNTSLMVSHSSVNWGLLSSMYVLSVYLDKY